MLSRIAIYLGLLGLLIGAGIAVDTQTLRPRMLLGAMQAYAQAPNDALPGENSPPEAKPADAPVQQPYVIEPPATPEPPAAVVTPSPLPGAIMPPPVVATPAPLPPEKPAITDPKKDVVSAKALFAAERLPSLVRFLEKFAPAAAKATGWNGILVGDMAQPRGGPTPYGHRSHQTGLDVDVWFMPMPGHTLTAEEREKTSAINLVADDWKRVSPKTWTPQHAAFIKTAAEQPGVERVLVNAAIKKEMCRVDSYRKSNWMAKVRPWYAHHDHIHVRMECPDDSPACRGQPEVTNEEDNGCSDKALAHWFSDKVLNPPKPTTPPKPPRPLTMADFPPACQAVLAAPERAQKN